MLARNAFADQQRNDVELEPVERLDIEKTLPKQVTAQKPDIAVLVLPQLGSQCCKIRQPDFRLRRQIRQSLRRHHIAALACIGPVAMARTNS
jgi:hypothetical protein